MEAAGLVLGVIPIVLSALDYYEQGMKICRRYKRYHREFKMVRTSLQVEQFKFKDSCMKILSQSFRDHEIKMMLEAPEGSAWRKRDNLDRLRRQLGDALDIFLVKAEEIFLTMDEFRARLGVHQIDKTKLQNPNLFEEHYKRLRFSLARRDYEDLLVRLRQDNSDLTALTSPTATLTPQPARNAYPADYVGSVRECVRSTYTSLKSHWKCQCKHFHKVILQLGRIDATRGSSIQSYSQEESGQPCFHIIFTYGNKHDSGLDSPPWDWIDTKLLSTSEDPRQPVTSNATGLGVLDNDEVSLLQNKASLTPKRKKRVRLQIADKENADASLHSSLRTLSIANSQNQITCICDTLSTRKHGQLVTGIGYIVDQNAKKRHHLIPLGSQSAAGLALRSLESAFSTPRLLRRQLRMRLATILSMSILEFGQTPWVDVGWSKKNILFVQDSNTPSYEDIFVSESITSEGALPPLKPTTVGFVRNTALFALGILLIELCFGKSAEAICQDYRVPSIVEADGSPKFPPDYNYIKVLLQAVADESDQNYCSAVRRCLHCSFDCNEDNLDSDEFRRAIYDGVVLPLEDNYRYMSGNKIDAVHPAQR